MKIPGKAELEAREAKANRDARQRVTEAAFVALVQKYGILRPTAVDAGLMADAADMYADAFMRICGVSQ